MATIVKVGQQQVTKDDVINLVLRGDGYAFLTAWRGELSAVDNYARMMALRHDLNVLGATVLLVKGVYEATFEWSYLAVDLGPNVAVALGKQWQQDCVLLPDALVFCSDGTKLPVKARSVYAGHPCGDHSVIYVNGEQVTHVVYFANVA